MLLWEKARVRAGLSVVHRPVIADFVLSIPSLLILARYCFNSFLIYGISGKNVPIDRFQQALGCQIEFPLMSFSHFAGDVQEFDLVVFSATLRTDKAQCLRTVAPV